MNDFDLTEFYGDPIEVEKKQTSIKAGRYNVELNSVDPEFRTGKNGWVGKQLNFKIQGTGVFAPMTITLKHDDQAKVDWSKADLAKLGKAIGIEGAFTNLKDLIGKPVSVSLKLNENGYPEIDSKFGNSWKPAEQITETPKVVKEEAPKEESNETDEIPF